MAGYTTVRGLIDNLFKVEDLDAPVIYQYYLGEHFDVSDKVFAEVAREFDSVVPCLADAYDAIAETVAEKDNHDGA